MTRPTDKDHDKGQPSEHPPATIEVKGEQVGDENHPRTPPDGEDGAADTTGPTPAEKQKAREAGREASSAETAAGASAPLSKPALENAPQDEDGPLISEADPSSNAG